MIARLLAGAAVWVNRSNRDIQSEKLTETIEAMANPAPAAGAIRRLYGLSVKVGIDAFGNGYSALAAIDRRAVREFKIDQSWWLKFPIFDLA